MKRSFSHSPPLVAVDEIREKVEAGGYFFEGVTQPGSPRKAKVA